MSETKYPCYIMEEDNKGEWRWVFYAKNGKAIAVSSEGYKAREDCLRSVEIVQASGSAQKYVKTGD